MNTAPTITQSACLDFEFMFFLLWTMSPDKIEVLIDLDIHLLSKTARRNQSDPQPT
jgi:hypothetical protein